VTSGHDVVGRLKFDRRSVLVKFTWPNLAEYGSAACLARRRGGGGGGGFRRDKDRNEGARIADRNDRDPNQGGGVS